MKKLFMLFILTIMLISCSSTKDIVYQHDTIYKTNTEYKTKIQYDSIYIHDSVTIKTENDTVYYTKFKNKYIKVHDTIVKEIYDTVYKTEYKEIPINNSVKKPNYWKNFCIFAIVILLIGGIGRFVLKKYL